MAAEERVAPIDSDVDLHVAAQRQELTRHRLDVLGVIAAGGALGAVARYGLSLAIPTAQDGFPWATFWTNVGGCLLIGVLMVLITEAFDAHRLTRPFLGVGVLGGFTTFSTYAVEVRDLLDGPAPGVGLAYLGGTLVAAVVAVELGRLAARGLTRSRRAVGATR